MTRGPARDGLNDESKWLMYEEQITPAGRKTKIWWVRAKEGGTLLGEIGWYGAWRQYVFYPRQATIFNRTCLRDLAAACDAAMVDRRSEPKATAQ